MIFRIIFLFIFLILIGSKNIETKHHHNNKVEDIRKKEQELGEIENEIAAAIEKASDARTDIMGPDKLKRLELFLQKKGVKKAKRQSHGYGIILKYYIITKRRYVGQFQFERSCRRQINGYQKWWCPFCGQSRQTPQKKRNSI